MQQRSDTPSRNRSVRALYATAAAAGFLAASSGASLAQDLGELIPQMSIVYYAADHGPEYQQTAQILVEDFAQLGLEVRLAPMQQSAMVSQIHVGGRLEDLAVGSWGGDTNRLDPNFWVNDLSACDSNRNAVKWCDETYTAMAKEQLRTLDETKRHELVWELQEYFQEHAPWWQISHRTQGILYNSARWEGVSDPAPIPPHETVIHPWLSMKPKGDDRILDWAHFEDVSTYNPLAESTSAGWLRFVYDTYLRFDGSDVTGWAADSWKVVDDTTIELHLREGMTFHDGQPVTADDAVFSINMMVDLQPAVLADALTGIVSAEKVDDLTFRIMLAEPNAAIFRQALVQLVILPKHIWEPLENPVDWDPIANNGVIGSGPFAFESWAPNQAHVLKTFKEHWAAPDYDGIRRLSLGQADAVRAAMVDGTADIATTVLPSATMEQLAESEDDLDFMASQSFSTLTVWLNHRKAPFNDLAFRKALRLATDKERVALEGWLGFSVPAGEGNVPIGLGAWYNDELETVPFDIDAARAVLEEAGYGWDSNGRLHFPPASAQPATAQ